MIKILLIDTVNSQSHTVFHVDVNSAFLSWSALKRLKERIHFQPIGFELLPEVFTMPQLQALYEAILEVHFDRRNFANKMLKLGVLEEMGDRPKNAARTVPIHYKFNLDKYKEMKSKGFRLEF